MRAGLSNQPRGNVTPGKIRARAIALGACRFFLAVRCAFWGKPYFKFRYDAIMVVCPTYTSIRSRLDSATKAPLRPAAAWAGVSDFFRILANALDRREANPPFR